MAPTGQPCRRICRRACAIRQPASSTSSKRSNRRSSSRQSAPDEELPACPTFGFPVGGPVVSCPLPALNTDRPNYEPLLWNDDDPATLAQLDLFAWADDAAARKARARSLAAPDDAAARTAADAATETARVSAAAARNKGAIQLSTNCYAYATNSRVGHSKDQKPQPGERSGAPAASAACPEMSAAVVRDGAPDNIKQAERCPYNNNKNRRPTARGTIWWRW